MATVIKRRRRSAVLTPSSLACISVLPTINLTSGCLHDCTYCYIRGYRYYPGESRTVLYEDTLERLRREVRSAERKPRAVYFSPSSDLFQPAPEVLDLSHAVVEFLLGEGIGVAFLTKGRIPEKTLRLLIANADLVRAQVGLISIDERISAAFEPNAAPPAVRLEQLGALIAGGVAAEARLDPVLPGVSDGAKMLDRHFEALARVGVRRAAAGILFLRPAILYWMRRSTRDRDMLASVLGAFEEREQTVMRGTELPIQNLPAERRQEILSRIQGVAAAHDIEVNVCACKNPDLASGTCNIAGTWPSRPPRERQPALDKA